MAKELASLLDSIDCCARCLFWLGNVNNSGEGICRRYPPAVVVTMRDGRGQVNWISAFPPMARAGWCGEFKLNKETLS